MPMPPEATSQIQRGFFELLENHFELTSLELRYECEEGRRRLLYAGFAVLCFMAAFALFNWGLVFAMVALGLPIFISCFILSVVWGLASYGVCRQAPKRDPRAGEPFAGTRAEFEETLRWIQNRFS